MSAAAEEVTADRVQLGIDGMTCSACATRLEKALTRATGVTSATVNFATEQADIRIAAGATDTNALADVVRKAGFTARQAAELDAGTSDERDEL
ncbi:MAG: heavy metal-associated domain-containing protein, partial [Gammaproteobacteria bacterium]|nr:heavy metal-associated domain-containing protein [Gammaproteobacteria bacterium]